VVDQYIGHGWSPRKALGPSDFQGSVLALIPHIEIGHAETECIWFSRRSYDDSESWELRRLSGSPFALVVVIPDLADDETRDSLLKDAELRMKTA
jgi:hypothetical protein